MHSELRRLHSPDTHDLATYAPADPAHFGVLIEALVGPSGQPGEESFAFVLCTPSWLAMKVTEHGSLWGRGYLMMDRYDYERVRAALEAECRAATGPDWDAVATKLGRKLHWEFEDYGSYTEQNAAAIGRAG